jgi:WD40 repeat protein
MSFAASGRRHAPTYDAFISYSRAVDGKLAPALQRGLQRFAKPWFRLRALRVFRDDASLSANPDLWGSIRDALDGSDYFILLASAESAASHWVAKEAEYWLEHRGAERLLIVLTDGELLWDGDRVDWSKTTALSHVFGEAFTEEPRYVDLRWARSATSVAARDPRFRDAVADLAAPMHGRSKDDLLGEDVRQHKRTLAIAWTAASLLALLALGATLAAVLAAQARNTARTEARTALSRQLAAESVARIADSNAIAPLLALESYRLVSNDPRSRGFDGRSAMLLALSSYPRLAVTLPQNGIVASAFTPDGGTLVTGDKSGAVRFWSHDGRPLSPPLSTGSPHAVQSVAVSPDGRLAAFGGGDGRLELWSVPKHRRLGPPLDNGSKGNGIETTLRAVNALAFSGDGKRLAVGRFDSHVEVWDVRASRRLFASDGPGTEVLSVAFGKNSGAVISTDGEAQTKVWSVPSGHLQRTIGHGLFRPVGFAEDGTHFVSAYDGVRFADALDRRRGLPLFRRFASVAAVTPDGKTLAARVGDAVQLWDLRRRKQFAELRLSSRENLSSLGFSPDGRLLESIADDGTARLWDVGRAEPLGTTFPATATAVALNSDGTLAAVATGKTVVLRDARTGHARGSTLHVPAGYVTSVAVSPDGQTIAAGGSRGDASVFGTADGAPATVHLESGGRIIGLTFSADGKRLALANEDGVLQWFDISQRQAAGESNGVTVPTCRTTGVTQSRYANCFEQIVRSPDGTKAAVYGGGGSIRLWDAVTEQPIGQLSTSGLDGTAVAFSPDGRLVAATGTDGTLTFSDVARQQPFGQGLPSGQSGILSIAFSGDGARLATVASNGTLRVWSPLLLSTDYNRWRARLCRMAGRNLTGAEWNAFVSGQTYHRTCPELPSATK